MSRTARQQAKVAEREFADALGGVRLFSGFWTGPGDVDVEGGAFYGQVKHRRWAEWLRFGLQQVKEAAAGTDKLPLLLLKDKPGSGADAQKLVCMTLEDFLAWSEKAAQLGEGDPADDDNGSG